MDRFLNRVVEIYGVGLGSGYAVGDDLVLTAGHVVAGAAEVRPLGATGWLPAVEAWRHPTLDAVLLRVPARPWAGAVDTGALRWGRCDAGERIRCRTTGFPWVQGRPDGVRDTDTAWGVTVPGAAAKAGGLLFDVATAAPRGRGGGSPWAGMSGAALLATPGGHLVGVVVEDQTAYGHQRFSVVPATALLAEPGFARAVGAGDAEPVPSSSRAVREPYQQLPPRYPDSWLLVPEYRVVEFVGRSAELAALHDWCDSTERFSIALLSGEGGAGKSRLAAELAARLRTAGWDTGIASTVDAEVWADFDPAWPVMLVFDYAERAVDALSTVIDRLSRRRAGPRVRLLLLARSTGSWWVELNQVTAQMAQTVCDLALPLAASGLSIEDRGQHAAAAVRGFARELDRSPAVEVDVSGSGYTTPLLIHIAALLAVTGWPAPPYGGGGLRDGLLRRLLDREEKRWLGTLPEHRLEKLHPVAARQAVAVATLVAPTPAHAAELLAVVPDLADDREARLKAARWLHDLFPGADGTIASLAPDLAVEQLLAQTTDLPAVAVALLQREEVDRPLLGRLLSALRLAAGHQPAVREALAQLLADGLPKLLMQVFISQSGALATLLASSLDLVADDPRVRRWATSLAPTVSYPSVPLASLGEVLTRIWVAATSTESAERAVALYHWGLWLSSLRRSAQALGAHEEAAGMMRALAADDPDRYRPMLAAALDRVADRLGALGRSAEGQAASQEAIDLYRPLVDSDPDRYLSQFGSTLHGLARHLTALGRPAEAMAPIQQAVDILRDLAEDDPNDPALASARITLGRALVDCGRHAEGIEVLEPAVAVQRALADRFPNRYLSTLGSSLCDLGRCRLAMGQPTQALDAASESVHILRRLAATHPELFARDLAHALVNLIVVVNALGRRAEELALAEELVAVYRPLADEDPNQYRPSLAMMLAMIGHTYDLLGRWADALPPAREAVELRRMAVADGAGDPDLATALWGLAVVLQHLGRGAEALATADEALTIFEQAARAGPGYEVHLNGIRDLLMQLRA